MLLTTTAALGFKVSIKKGARSSQLTWVGVRLTLTEDHLMMGLPEAYYGHTPEELGRTRHGTDTGASSSSRQGIVAVRKTAKGTMGGEHFLQSAPRSTGRHQDGCRRSTAIRPQRQQGQVCLVPRQTVGTSAALAHFLSGDGDGQTHQEVQAGQGQIPDSSHYHRCVPRGARCRLAHQQQGHQGLQLSGHPRRRQGAGLRAGQFKLPRHSGDPGSGGGPQALGQRAEYVQPPAASPVGQPSSPGDDTENVHEGHPHTRVSQHYRGLPEPPQQTQGGGHAPGAARSTNPAAEGQDSWILLSPNARRRRPTAVGVRCSRRVRVVNIALGGSRTRTFDISPDNLKAKKCCSRLRSAATHVTCCHSHHPYNFTWVVL